LPFLLRRHEIREFPTDSRGAPRADVGPDAPIRSFVAHRTSGIRAQFYRGRNAEAGSASERSTMASGALASVVDVASRAVEIREPDRMGRTRY
jgi:hypothetical protein